MTATARLLPGNRLHLQHGPIDLVIGADGDASAIRAAYRAAAGAFPSILPALVGELPLLRTPASDIAASATGPVARRMIDAVWPYRERFVTPMAAVAGSVADHVLAAMIAAAPLRRAYVNNGGDVALHLTAGTSFDAGVVGDLSVPTIDAHVRIAARDGVGGLATSGWRGRSHSLGIADAVTVLARDAAAADAAATMIANAVDIDDPGIARRPACAIKDDSDLGQLPVTVAVGRLAAGKRRAALRCGQRRALEFLAHKRIIAAYIQLQGEMIIVGADAPAVEAA